MSVQELVPGACPVSHYSLCLQCLQAVLHTEGKCNWHWTLYVDLMWCNGRHTLWLPSEKLTQLIPNQIFAIPEKNDSWCCDSRVSYFTSRGPLWNWKSIMTVMNTLCSQVEKNQTPVSFATWEWRTLLQQNTRQRSFFLNTAVVKRCRNLQIEE